MASVSLYPPTIDTAMPAFVAVNNSSCRAFFSLSKFSSTSTIKSVHVSIVKQSSGQSVVNKTDNAEKGRYRSAGIIIVNSAPIPVEGVDNYYYIDILNEDIKAGDKIGWRPGWIYKFQIRLSAVEYQGTPGQAAWLVAEAGNFSEWSTYCTTKATGMPLIQVPIFEFDSGSRTGSNSEETIPVSLSTLEFSGTYSNPSDVSETLYSYKLDLYSDVGKKIESSNTLYTNQYYTPNQMKHLFKTELIDGKDYSVNLEYTTINKLSGSYTFRISNNHSVTESTTISAITCDNVDSAGLPEEYVKKFKKITSLEVEEEEGRVGIKLYMNSSNVYNGNICLRRASSKDNYSSWDDIKIVVCTNKIVNDLDIIYDNTVESNVWYKYAIQTIGINGERSLMNPAEPERATPIIREFRYSYLIGENGKQLALKFNSNMNSYIYNYSESKTDTIGGKYPFITRNGNMKYRTFPVNALISFNMDENGLFITDEEIYCGEDGKPYKKIISDYQKRRDEEHFDIYDYKREYDFREKVLEFLQDGKPKLFKSATEGNIIVRLMQVAAQPNQSLDRMIYSFTSTAHEVAEATMANYLKYNFYSVGNYSTSFEFYQTRIGQLDIDFKIGENIIQKIWEKYDMSTRNIGGIRRTLKKVHHLSLEFTDPPLRVYTEPYKELVLGNNIQYNDSTIITVRAGYKRTYIFDENVSFVGKYNPETKQFVGNSVKVLGTNLDNDIYNEKGELINTVHVTVDFLYDVGEEPYVEKQIAKKVADKNIGQVFSTYRPGANIYNEVYYKFYYEWELQFRRLTRVNWTCIEALPGAVFKVIDTVDNDQGGTTTREMYHDMNWTGVLNFEGLGPIVGLSYVGMRKPDGTIDDTVPCDVIVDYLYYIARGDYKERK